MSEGTPPEGTPPVPPEGTPPAPPAPPAPPEGTPPAPPAPPAPPEGTPPAPPSGESDFAKMRDSLQDEDLKKQAAQYNSFEDMTKSVLKMRQKGSEPSLKIPTGDSDPAEVLAWQKAMGIPEEASGYEFPTPDQNADQEFVKEAQGKWGALFHKYNLSGEGAKEFMAQFQEDVGIQVKQEIEADAEFAKQSMDLLEKEWGKDMEVNKEFANKAAMELFGDTLEDVKHMQTKDGRFVLDHPAFVRAFGSVGREMSEGGMGEAVTDAQKQTAREMADSAREKRITAQNAGKPKEAKYWDEEERKALAVLDKPQNLVGQGGRVM